MSEVSDYLVERVYNIQYLDNGFIPKNPSWLYDFLIQYASISYVVAEYLNMKRKYKNILIVYLSSQNIFEWGSNIFPVLKSLKGREN